MSSVTNENSQYVTLGDFLRRQQGKEPLRLFNTDDFVHIHKEDVINATANIESQFSMEYTHHSRECRQTKVTQLQKYTLPSSLDNSNSGSESDCENSDTESESLVIVNDYDLLQDQVQALIKRVASLETALKRSKYDKHKKMLKNALRKKMKRTTNHEISNTQTQCVEATNETFVSKPKNTSHFTNLCNKLHAIDVASLLNAKKLLKKSCQKTTKNVANSKKTKFQAELFVKVQKPNLKETRHLLRENTRIDPHAAFLRSFEKSCLDKKANLRRVTIAPDVKHVIVLS